MNLINVGNCATSGLKTGPFRKKFSTRPANAAAKMVNLPKSGLALIHDTTAANEMVRGGLNGHKMKSDLKVRSEIFSTV